MSRKRRFRRKTLGRLQMFFQRKPYTGYKNFSVVEQNSMCFIADNPHTSNARHYKDVTKKTLHYTNYSLCQRC